MSEQLGKSAQYSEIPSHRSQEIIKSPTFKDCGTLPETSNKQLQSVFTHSYEPNGSVMSIQSLTKQIPYFDIEKLQCLCILEKVILKKTREYCNIITKLLSREVGQKHERKPVALRNFQTVRDAMQGINKACAHTLKLLQNFALRWGCKCKAQRFASNHFSIPLSFQVYLFALSNYPLLYSTLKDASIQCKDLQLEPSLMEAIKVIDGNPQASGQLIIQFNESESPKKKKEKKKKKNKGQMKNLSETDAQFLNIYEFLHALQVDLEQREDCNVSQEWNQAIQSFLSVPGTAIQL